MNPNDLESALSSALHRRYCPDPHELGEYALGMLMGNARDRVQDHVGTCPPCQTDLQELLQYVNRPEPAWTHLRNWAVLLWREAERAAGRIVQVTLRPLDWASSPMPRLVRGADAGIQADVICSFALNPDAPGDADAADDLDVEAVVVRNAGDPHTCTVRIRAEVPSLWPVPSHMRVVAEAATWRAEAITDERNEATFVDLPAGLIEQLVIVIHRITSDKSDTSGRD